MIKFSFNDISENIKVLKSRYHSSDPFEIAESAGIEIIYASDIRRLKGMYRVIKRNRFIILNSKNSDKMNKIVCAHELGHDQLHREYAKERPFQEFMLYDMTSRREYEANIFASELLLDTDTVIEHINNGYDSMQIAKITETDINLVALKVDFLIHSGYQLNQLTHNSKFLK